MRFEDEGFDTMPGKVSAIFSKVDRIERLLNNHPSFKDEEKDEIMTIDEASKYLSLAVQTIYGLVSNRKIPYFKRKGSKRLYFSKQALKDWLMESKCYTGSSKK